MHGDPVNAMTAAYAPARQPARYGRGERICGHCGERIYRVPRVGQAATLAELTSPAWHTVLMLSAVTSDCYRGAWPATRVFERGHQPRTCCLCHVVLAAGEARPLLDPFSRDGEPGDNWICLDEGRCDRAADAAMRAFVRGKPFEPVMLALLGVSGPGPLAAIGGGP